MANRFWVGGTGTWDNANTANWSATSGGAGGASAPTTADDVFFDANSGTSAIVTVDATATCRNCTINKADLTLSLAGNAVFTTITTLTTGAIILNGNTLSTGVFYSNNSNVRSIDFGLDGKIEITLVSAGTGWDIRDLTNFSCAGSRQVVLTTAGAMATTIYHRGAGASEAKAVSFKFVAASGAPILAGTSIILDLDLSEMAGTTAIGNTAITIYGNLLLASTNVFTAGGTGWTFAATSGPKTINTNGVTIDWPWLFNGVGGSWRLDNNLTYGSTRTFTLTNGTFDANGYNVTAGGFGLNAGTKTLTLGSGTWTITGANWNANTNVANLTVSPSAGIISMTSASAKTFAGGALSWPRLNQGGSGALTVQQSNTFANITNTVQPATITLTSGTTQTVAAFGVSGTAGNLITLNSSTAGTRATLSDSIGTVEVSNVSIQDINATGGANWNAFVTDGNVDAGNNTGWDFRAMIRRAFREVFRAVLQPVFFEERLP